MERYARHTLIDWFSQEKIAASKVAVIGAGAVGNEVIKNLTLLGIGEIEVFDFDKIEEHNLTKSVLFRTQDVGLLKAEVAAARAAEFDPNVTIRPHAGDFWKLLSIRQLKGYDTVFCCVDNFEARIRCNTVCFLAGVDLVNIGIDSRFAVVETFPFSITADAGCYECSLPGSVYQRMAQRYSCGHLRKISFVERKVPTTIVTSSVAGAIAVSLGLRLGGNSEPPIAVRVMQDTITGSVTRTQLAKSDGCPACGRLPHNILPIPSGRALEAISTANLVPGSSVEFSEPLLASYQVGDIEHIVFGCASDFDDTFSSGVSADPDAVSLDVRDHFTVEELHGKFSGKLVPAKFALISRPDRRVVIEFEGEVE